jgi:hypothetical protein
MRDRHNERCRGQLAGMCQSVYDMLACWAFIHSTFLSMHVAVLVNGHVRTWLWKWCCFPWCLEAELGTSLPVDRPWCVVSTLVCRPWCVGVVLVHLRLAISLLVKLSVYCFSANVRIAGRLVWRLDFEGSGIMICLSSPVANLSTCTFICASKGSRWMIKIYCRLGVALRRNPHMDTGSSSLTIMSGDSTAALEASERNYV